MNSKNIKQLSKTLILTTLLATLGGCASPGIDRAEQNQIIKTFYATVIEEKQVELSSDVKTGIVGGAGVGLADNLDGDKEDMIAGTLAGALVFGLFTAIFEGSNQAYQYTLSSPEQGRFTLIQKQQLEANASCVRIKTGANVTMTAVATENCISLDQKQLLPTP